MNNFKLTKKALVFMSLFIATNAGAVDFTVTPVQFDPDGTGGANSAQAIGSVDWAPGSVLATNNKNQDGADPHVIPWPAATTKSFQTVAQGVLNGVTDTAGDPAPPIVGLNLTTGFEITYTQAYGNIGTSDADSTNIAFPGVMGSLGVDDDSRFLNEVTIYYDDAINDGTKANSLSGEGFNDGDVILRGVVVRANGNFSRARNGAGELLPNVTFDQFNTDNWGIQTVQGGGSTDVFILVTEVDTDFFPDLTVNSLLAYDSNQTTPYANTNPSFSLFSESIEFPVSVGDPNGEDGPDIELQTDATTTFSILENPALGCRVTGGGNDTSGVAVDAATGDPVGYDGTEASGHSVKTVTVVKGKKTYLVEEVNDYTMGLQAGANTGKQPQPKGELSHTNHDGPAGQWTFHMGTASAPPGTEVDEIICSDEGWCRQARPAPDKQIDFDGIGTFKNIIDQGNLPKECANEGQNGHGPNASLATYNWAEVHIEDRGEPGKEGQHTVAGPGCPAIGTGTDAFDNVFGAPVFNEFVCLADGGPDCPDFYRLRIYCGVEPEFDAEGNLTEASFNAIKAQKYSAPIYEVYGYIDGGNFQIHPPTGFDLK